jgi:hypothetical protein
MEPMKLSVLSVLLGLGVSVTPILGLLKPAAFVAAVRSFPRSKMWGYILMALGTVWFLFYLKDESVSDFAAYKPMMFLGFSLLGLLACIYLTDFLAVRGLAIVLLLLGKLMVDTARWSDSEWRLIIVTWAYVLVTAGMWFTVSPWRCRDFLLWTIESPQRMRIIHSLRLAFGLLVILLGLVVF